MSPGPADLSPLSRLFATLCAREMTHRPFMMRFSSGTGPKQQLRAQAGAGSMESIHAYITPRFAVLSSSSDTFARHTPVKTF